MTTQDDDERVRQVWRDVAKAYYQRVLEPTLWEPDEMQETDIVDDINRLDLPMSIHNAPLADSARLMTFAKLLLAARDEIVRLRGDPLRAWLDKTRTGSPDKSP
jgi:hypothetical protein